MIIVLGLITGRHPLPVSEYIINRQIGALDFEGIRDIVEDKLNNIFNDKTNSSNELFVYITGLTAATAEVIRYCSLHNVALTLMHYDRETESYIPQKIF